MSSLMRIRPTKIELIKLRRRLSASIRVEKILYERLTVLVNEYLASLKEAVEKRFVAQRRLLSVYRRAGVMLGVYGPGLRSYLREVAPKPKVYSGAENIMGVKVKTVVLKYDEKAVEVPPGIEEFISISRDALLDLVDLAKLEYALRELGREISSTRRKANALKYIVIPRLRANIKILQLKFDERERGEKAVLKRIKQVLARRGVSWTSTS